MRKTITSLMAVVSAAAAFGVVAGPAAADDPTATQYNVNPSPATDGFHGQRCETAPAKGVLGTVPGNWGWYVDGCTTNPVRCESTLTVGHETFAGTCTVRVETHFATETNYGHQVSQNARLWITGRRGDVRSLDWSCVGVTECSVTQTVPDLGDGDKVAVQCNGVRENKDIVLSNGDHYQNFAHDSCSATLKGDPIHPTPNP